MGNKAGSEHGAEHKSMIKISKIHEQVLIPPTSKLNRVPRTEQSIVDTNQTLQGSVILSTFGFTCGLRCASVVA